MKPNLATIIVKKNRYNEENANEKDKHYKEAVR